MRMNESLTERNNIKIWGQGTKPVFFIYGCDQQMWRFITPAFEQTHKIVLMDLVGSGQSDTNAYDYEKYASLEGYACDIVEICETFAFENIISYRAFGECHDCGLGRRHATRPVCQIGDGVPFAPLRERWGVQRRIQPDGH